MRTTARDRVLHGLSTAQAEAKQAAQGYNDLPQPERRTELRIIFEVLREPMLALLLGGGLVYLALGDAGEALILLIFVMFSIFIAVIQETRTEHVLQSLRDLTSPRALVIRDGQRRRIPGREVVCGDLIVLAEGDRVPADAVLLQSHDLKADESLLTGESVPVSKQAQSEDAVAYDKNIRPGGEGLSFVFSGSLIVRGSGIAEVTATGANSEIGKIGQSLNIITMEPPRLQMQTRQLVQVSALAGAAVSALVVALYGFLRGGWLDATLAGIAIGMSMLPEEFPVVLSVFMAMGAWRLSRVNVLTRRASAIETLGSATVLCTDKTGTLTENRMRVAELRLKNGDIFRVDSARNESMPGVFQTLVEFSVLASARDFFDPMEKAFHQLASEYLQKTERLHPDWELRHIYGLRPDLLAVSHVWKPNNNARDLVVAVKGAPETIAALCRLGDVEQRNLITSATAMAAEGLRVLGVAHAQFSEEALPDSPHGFSFVFLGLVGLIDPLRSSVPEAVRQCRSAGIRVIMITGDYPVTAAAIARQAGIDADEIMTGEEIKILSQTALERRIRKASVFARVLPEQKLQIVNALKKNGDIVAMTGDGVNDAPSLKAAHIGIAMGGRGTDVAREASAIVLLDDDFSSIIAAIRLGRRIYDNLRKAMRFIFAVHVPIAGLALLPLLFGFPLLLGPIHIAFLEMIIDPVCSLAFEAEVDERYIMQRPPRDKSERLFSLSLMMWSLIQGVLAFIIAAGIFFFSIKAGLQENQIRGLVFISIVLSIISLILTNRSSGSFFATFLSRPNLFLVVIVPAVIVMLTLIFFLPTLQNIFSFGFLDVNSLILPVCAGFFLLILLEALKPLQFKRR